MILLSVLSFAAVLSILYGSVPIQAAVTAGVLISACIIILKIKSGGENDMIGGIEYGARNSEIVGVNPLIKCVTSVVMIFTILIVDSIYASLFLTIVCGFIVVIIGKTPLKIYVRLMTLPLVFILASMLSLLFDFSHEAIGVANAPFFGGYICVERVAQESTKHVVSRAVACVSCLYALSLTTPLSQIIESLRKLKLPEIVIELMFLIYRYIFILNKTLKNMRISAQSRLGFINVRTSVLSTGNIMNSLLGSSFRRASRSFDAMESRGYKGKIVFSERDCPVKGIHVIFSLLIFAAFAGVSILERGLM